MLVCWCVGGLVCWYVGELVSLCFGELVSWCIGVLASCMKFEGGDDSATSDLQSHCQCDNVWIVRLSSGKIKMRWELKPTKEHCDDISSLS